MILKDCAGTEGHLLADDSEMNIPKAERDKSQERKNTLRRFLVRVMTFVLALLLAALLVTWSLNSGQAGNISEAEDDIRPAEIEGREELCTKWSTL